jgi:hypothetical protein
MIAKLEEKFQIKTGIQVIYLLTGESTYYMRITCVSHVYHMSITCVSHAYYMCTTCVLHAYYMRTACVLHAYYMRITCVFQVQCMLIVCLVPRRYSHEAIRFRRMSLYGLKASVSFDNPWCSKQFCIVYTFGSCSKPHIVRSGFERDL